MIKDMEQLEALLDEDTTLVCVFCDVIVEDDYCHSCNEYKGLMTVSHWEEYTGETWSM